MYLSVDNDLPQLRPSQARGTSTESSVLTCHISNAVEVSIGERFHDENLHFRRFGGEVCEALAVEVAVAHEPAAAKVIVHRSSFWNEVAGPAIPCATRCLRHPADDACEIRGDVADLAGARGALELVQRVDGVGWRQQLQLLDHLIIDVTRLALETEEIQDA